MSVRLARDDEVILISRLNSVEVEERGSGF